MERPANAAHGREFSRYWKFFLSFGVHEFRVQRQTNLSNWFLGTRVQALTGEREALEERLVGAAQEIVGDLSRRPSFLVPKRSDF